MGNIDPLVKHKYLKLDIKQFNFWKLKMFRGLLFVFALTNYVLAFAYDKEFIKENLADELLECSAYHFIIGKSLSTQTGQEDLSADYFKSSINMMNRAKTLKKSKSDKAINATLSLAMQSQMREIDFNFNNIEILMAKLAFHCQDVCDNPEERTRYWFSKEQQISK